jgi:hypothetical protein
VGPECDLPKACDLGGKGVHPKGSSALHARRRTARGLIRRGPGPR